jgi:nucleoside-diphosphate-sugar epimerase
LTERGASVVAFSRTPPPWLPPTATFVSGDIRDREAVRAAMGDCDVVAHFAWVVRPLRSADDTHAINVGGTQNVVDAMDATGARRLVFSSSVLAYGARPDNPDRLTEASPLRPNPGLLYSEHKAAAEHLINRSGVAAAISRSSMIIGRRVGNYGLDLGALPVLVRLGDRPMRLQMLHQDDAVRFHVEACLGTQEGAVNLASQVVIDEDEAAEIAQKRLVNLPPRLVDAALEAAWRLGVSDIDPVSKNALAYWPIVDCTALTEAWEFSCAWDTRAALSDFARATSRTVFLGNRVVEPPWRFRLARTDDTPGSRPGADGDLGVSPLSRDLLAQTYDACRAVAGGAAASRLDGLFGMRALHAATSSRVDAGPARHDGVGSGVRRWLAMAGVGREITLLRRDERSIAMAPAEVAGLSDERLVARIELLADLFVHTATVLAVTEAAVADAVERATRRTSLADCLAIDPSPAGSALAMETAALGRDLDGRLDASDVAELSAQQVFDIVAERSQIAAGRLRAILAACAWWRIDPADLASPVLDDPRVVVAAALRARANRPPVGEPSGRAGTLPRAIHRLLTQRYLVRATGERVAVVLGAALLERGSRLSQTGRFPGPHHVFGATLAEVTRGRFEAAPDDLQWPGRAAPDVQLLCGAGPLTLDSANVTLPLTVLVPAVNAVQGRYDIPWCDGAVAAARMGVPFRAGPATATASGRILTVGAT